MKPIKINSGLEKCLENKERDNLKVSSLKDLGEIKIVRVLGKEDSYIDYPPNFSYYFS